MPVDDEPVDFVMIVEVTCPSGSAVNCGGHALAYSEISLLAALLRLSPPFSRFDGGLLEPPPSRYETSARINQPDVLEHLQVVSECPWGMRIGDPREDLPKAPGLAIAQDLEDFLPLRSGSAYASRLRSKPPLPHDYFPAGTRASRKPRSWNAAVGVSL